MVIVLTVVLAHRSLVDVESSELIHGTVVPTSMVVEAQLRPASDRDLVVAHIIHSESAHATKPYMQLVHFAHDRGYT